MAGTSAQPRDFSTRSEKKKERKENPKAQAPTQKANERNKRKGLKEAGKGRKGL
jgi:hypothetical protein